jgi:hypothetical protein
VLREHQHGRRTLLVDEYRRWPPLARAVQQQAVVVPQLDLAQAVVARSR